MPQDTTKQEEMQALAGAEGAQVLKGAAMAADDLERAGIVAKDADESAGEQAIEETAAQADESAADEQADDEAATSPAKPDFAAMKETIAQMAQAVQAGDKTKDGSETDAALKTEVIQLRELVATLTQEVDDLKADNAAHNAQMKDFVEWKELPSRFASLREEHDQAMEVLTGIFDLLNGSVSGAKSLVIERNGNGSAHDPDGEALQQQLLSMVETKALKSNGSGDYAGDRLIPA